MLICNPYEVVIQGITSNGKKFRPSDWAERLCGVLSSFDNDHRLSYHRWVRPILIDNVRCVAVDKKLEEISPQMFDFMMGFAADNDLRIIDCKALLEEHNEARSATDDVRLEEALQAKAEKEKAEPAVEVPASVRPAVVREVQIEEAVYAFSVLQRLHESIRDSNQFMSLLEIQKREGYRLLGVFEEGKQNAVAVCGFRIMTDFADGRHLYINDLVTGHDAERRGYGSLLLDAVKNMAKEQHCTGIHTDSSVNAGHNDAHRLYLKHGFIISGHRFSCML